MGFFKEFKEFAMRGNVVDLAVGVIMGAAFAPIVDSLVKDIITPPIGYVIGGVDFSSLSYKIKLPPNKLAQTAAGVVSADAKKSDKPEVTEAAKAASSGEVEIRYGKMLQAIFTFIITAFSMFCLIKAMNTLMRPSAAAPPPPTPSEALLKDIRDLLAKR